MPVGLYSHTMPSAVTGARQKPFGSKCADGALQFCLSPGATTIRTREDGRGPVYCQVLAVSTPLFAYQPLGPKCERKAAEGRFHAAMGRFHAAMGRFHAAMGRFHAAMGRFHAAMGRFHAAMGRFHAAMGRFHAAMGRFHAAMGRF